MKRFLTITIMVLMSIFLFGQTATNYKEGDFTGKQLKAKSWKFDNNWLIDKTSAGTIQYKYNNSLVAALTNAGALSVTSLTNTGATTTTTLTATAVSVSTSGITLGTAVPAAAGDSADAIYMYSTSKKWRIRIDNAGVLYAVTVTP